MEQKIAIIGAIKDEIAGIKQEMRIDDTLRWKTGNAFVGTWQGVPLVLVRSGMGGQRAQRALTEVVEQFSLERVFSIGYAGALDPSLQVGDLVFADKVMAVKIDAPENSGEKEKSYDLAEVDGVPDVHGGALLTVDRPAATPREKKALRKKFKAVAVDMETFALAEAAQSRNLPLISVRAITDTADQELIDCAHLVAEDGDVSKLKAGWHVLTHPGDLKGMIELGQHARMATANLTAFLRKYLDSGKQ